MKNLLKNKLFNLLIFILIVSPGAYAGDFSQNAQNYEFMDYLDPQEAVKVENATGMDIFDEQNTKVIHTKGGLWRNIFTFGKKKKKSDNVFEPEVIDYDYDTETEEIIPVYKENKNDKNEKTDEVKVKELKSGEKVKKAKDKKNKNQTNNEVSKSDVNIFCDNMEYFDEKKEIVGTGNAKVVFVENNSVMTADKIIYNHDLNYIEGIDNVRINRDGRVMEGDYTKVDLNYGNAMTDNPIINDSTIKVVAKSGTATTDTIEAYDGVITTDNDGEFRFYSAQHAAYFEMEINSNLYRKFYPKDYRTHNKKYHIKTKELYVDSTDGHDTLTFKNADIYYGKILMMKGSDIKLSTDKTQSFVETTIPEVGSMRYVGSYVGPSFVFNTPKSSTLRLSPLIVFDDNKLGVGLLARFRHKRNTTQAIYSTAAKEFVARGRQQLGDTDFFVEYAHMAYMNDWFFGSNISKYLLQLVYQKQFIYPELGMSISHRATAGYLTDEENKKGTSRFRYQAMFTKNLAEIHNYDRKFYAGLDLIAQGMMGVYGTGDSIGVFRIGPSIRTQYRGWGQRITYYQTTVGGESALPYTDGYRYGGANVQLIESLRLNKYLSLGYYASLNLNNDDYLTHNMFSESRILVSIGPENAKFSFGYDMIRQGAALNYTALIGLKNHDISFKKLFMKNPDKFGKDPNPKKVRNFHIFNTEVNDDEENGYRNDAPKEDIDSEYTDTINPLELGNI